MVVRHNAEDRIPSGLIKILESMTYKLGWHLYAYSVFNSGSRFFAQKFTNLRRNIPDETPDTVFVRPIAPILDVNTGNPSQLTGEAAVIHHWMSEQQVVDVVFNAIRGTEIHEVAEWFQYNGIRVFDPHREKNEREKLMELALGEDLLPPDMRRQRREEAQQMQMAMMANPDIQGLKVPLDAEVGKKWDEEGNQVLDPFFLGR